VAITAHKEPVTEMALSVPPEIIARIKDETDIVEIVRSYVTLRPSGASFKGLCPFHTEKTPSFHVNPSRQFYKCFGCGVGGDVIAFLMAIESVTFPEALEALARPLDIDLARYLREDDGDADGERRAFLRAHEVATGLFREALWDAQQGRRAREYLAQRGFEPETLAGFDVGFAPGGASWQRARLADAGVDEELALRAGLLRSGRSGGSFAYFRDRIIFPIRNIAKQVTGFGGRIIDSGEPKYLNSADSAYFNKGKLLYGFEASRLPIARRRTAILVEGYLDLLAMFQAGINNVVATCGTAFTPDQARLIRRGATAVVMLFDGDRAGLQAAVRACHVALATGLEPSVARLPADADPASLLESGDREPLERLLESAAPYLPFLLSLVEERDAGRQGRERALRQALTSIAEVSDPIRREYLMQEAADLFGIRLAALREHLAGQQRKSRRHRGEVTSGQTTDTTLAPKSGAAMEGSGTAPRGDDGSVRGHGVPRRRIRSLRAVNAAEIEKVLFAHVLRDGSGLAARTFLADRDGLPLSHAAAERLARELEAWQAEQGSDASDPAAFVRQRWYGDDDGDDTYRAYVTDVLAKEDVPDETDFARAVKESLERLRLGRGAEPR
jgi:DNA primase